MRPVSFLDSIAPAIQTERLLDEGTRSSDTIPISQYAQSQLRSQGVANPPSKYVASSGPPPVSESGRIAAIVRDNRWERPVGLGLSTSSSPDNTTWIHQGLTTFIV